MIFNKINKCCDENNSGCKAEGNLYDTRKQQSMQSM